MFLLRLQHQVFAGRDGPMFNRSMLWRHELASRLLSFVMAEQTKVWIRCH